MCVYASLWQEELKADHASYLRQHPEIRALISDFLQFLLLRKPEDVFQFAREYFLTFASSHPLQESPKTHKLWKHIEGHISHVLKQYFSYILFITLTNSAA